MPSYSKTILYVDDDDDDVTMLRSALEMVSGEHQLLDAPDGIQALALLRQLQDKKELPGLVVLDINMPRMNGKETLVALQKDEALSCIPVVLFSTSSSILDKNFSMERNVELIVKPFDFKSLYITANKLLSYCRHSLSFVA